MGLYLLNCIARRRALIAIVTLCAAVAATAFVLLASPRFMTKALLLPPVEETGEGIMSAYLSRLNIPSIVAPQTAGTTAAAILVDLMRSRRLAEMIIRDLDLKTRFKAVRIEDALDELENRTTITVSETGLIKLGVVDKDPALALAIAERYIAGLDSINRFLQVSRAEKSREVLSRELVRYRRELSALHDRAARFQEKHGVVDIDEQVRGAVDVAANIKVRAILAGIERDLLADFARSDALEFKRKDAEYEILNRQLRSIVDGDSAAAVFIPLRSIPAIEREYASLERDLEVGDRVYAYLLERYEEAGVQLVRTMPAVQVVDAPELPEKRFGFSRPLLVILVTVLVLLWMCLTVAWWEWISAKGKSPADEQAFRELGELLRSDVAWLRRTFRF